MTVDELVVAYQEIARRVNKQWPLKNQRQRVFARTMKILEELGELSDEILSSMKLQRETKLKRHSRQTLEAEFADVLASLVLLAIELDIDIAKVMKKKIDFTNQRIASGQLS